MTTSGQPPEDGMTDPTPPTVPVPAAGPPPQRATADPPLRKDPPPGGPTDPADRTVSPIAHPPVVLPPNPAGTDDQGAATSATSGFVADTTPAHHVDPAAPVPQRAPGAREVVIGVLGLVCLGSAFLPWQHLPAASAWSIGMWVGPVLGFLGAAAHLIRYLPPADKAFGALLPLLLATAAVWVPAAHLYGNIGTAGTWTCLGAGVFLVGALLAAAMTDPALRSPDNPDDLFD